MEWRLIFMTDHDLQLKACALRRAMLQLIAGAGAGHTGGGLSCLDILNVLYNRVLKVCHYQPCSAEIPAEASGNYFGWEVFKHG
jgi:transketolase N-terminal domain/subunit